jgi:NitT/TauT family transport system permease protein
VIPWGLLWERIGQMEVTFFAPLLLEVLTTLVEIIGTPAFLKALGETGYAFSAGVFSAVSIGIPVGILMGRSRPLDELLLPWVNVFLSAPLTALVPVRWCCSASA